MVSPLIQKKRLARLPKLIDYVPRAERPSFVEWCPKNIILSSEGNDRPGPYIFDPWQREPAEAYDDPTVIQITKKWFGQAGKTLEETAYMLYLADVTHDPAMWIMPSMDMLDRQRKVKMMPILNACPALSDRAILNPQGEIPEAGFRYKGGFVPFASARSAGGMKNHPARVVFADEVDEYRAKTDASNPLDLLKQRLQSFNYGKLICSSTPGMKGESLIDNEYQKSDMRRYFVPCPHDPKNEEKYLWEREHVIQDEYKSEGEVVVTDDDDNKTVEIQMTKVWRLYCPCCGVEITEPQRLDCIRKGEWRPTNPDGGPGHRGYQISQLYSMTSSIQRTFSTFDPNNIVGFLTQVMAECYESVEIEAPNAEALEELYGVEQEGKVWAVTAGVDTQGDRIEFSIFEWYGTWAEPRTRVIGHYTTFVEDDHWKKAFTTTWKAIQSFRPCMTFWDIGTNKGGDFVKSSLRKYFPTPIKRGTLMPIRGQDNSDSSKWDEMPYIHTERRHKDGKMLPPHLQVNSSVIKKRLVPALVDAPTADEPFITFEEEYSRFPTGYMLQLTAERLDRVIVTSSMRERLLWKKIRPRNEALDCLVYGFAAAHYLGPRHIRTGTKVNKAWLNV